jgi:hypothetical protein
MSGKVRPCCISWVLSPWLWQAHQERGFISKRYPETDWLAWVFLGIKAGMVTIFTLLRLVALLWA